MNNDTSDLTENASLTETNLVLAKIVLKTIESGQIKVTDHLPLFSIFESIAQSTHALSSNATAAIQCSQGDAMINSRAKYDSIGSFHDSSSLPSSVHVTGVTQDNRLAQEPTAFPGVSVSGDVNHAINQAHYDTDGSAYIVSSESSNGTRKRSVTDLSDIESSVAVKSRVMRGASTETGLIHSCKGLKEYVELNGSVPHEIELAHRSMMEANPDLCNRHDISFSQQSLVVLEHSATYDRDTPSDLDLSLSSGHQSYARESSKAPASPQDFFEHNKVIRLLAVERPSLKAQVYVASGLRSKFHFSCPTSFLPFLCDIIRQKNNNQMGLVFVPCSTSVSSSQYGLNVINGISTSEMETNECGDDKHRVVMDVITAGGSTSSSSVTSMKRSNYSMSIGLQTMYSHQQHLARYSMLPHSKPHVLSVKSYPTILTNTILSVYQITKKAMESASIKHPFYERKIESSNIKSHRQMLRNDLLKHLVNNGYEGDISHVEELMFESCTVQPTAALGFHRDLMNCPMEDNTIACIVPYCDDKNDKQIKCLSYLFYTRKCVGDYVRRMDIIDAFLDNPAECRLTRLCLKSLMNTGGIFDYQGSLFEATESLVSIASQLESKKGFSCPDVKAFSGLRCFKHGAAFDKMGYYSIFVNVFITMHYKGFVQNLNDAISLCMYFGLMCNGTSSLAALWHELHSFEEEALSFYRDKKKKIKVFRLLITLDRNRETSTKKGSIVLYGNCKSPRFQYANYANDIVGNAKEIHTTVNDFLTWRRDEGSKKSVQSQHVYLMDKLKKFKGIGPLSFNQFWHSLCLCGILPPSYIESSIVAQGSGPAKLIQTFYPSVKSSDHLLKKLIEVKNAISSLGLKRISEFFIENEMCEIWRLANRHKFLSKTMTLQEKCQALMSSEFSRSMRESDATRNPDLYFCNPYTGTYQHLFRVHNKELVMRLSYVDNCPTSSIQLQCEIQYNEATGNLSLNWGGDYLKSISTNPSAFFVNRCEG